MEITKVVKPFIRRGCQYFWQYSACVCTVYMCYVYINTHTCMYIFKKNMLHLYIKLFIYDILYAYKYIHANK